MARDRIRARAKERVRVRVSVSFKVRVKVTVRMRVSVSCAFSVAFVRIAACTRANPTTSDDPGNWRSETHRQLARLTTGWMSPSLPPLKQTPLMPVLPTRGL